MSGKEKINIGEKVMSQIRRGQVKIRPRWYFLLGSIAMVLGLAGLAIVSIFFVSLVTFSLRSHGPMGAVRFEQLLSNFPWMAVLVAVVGLVLAIWMLRKYDFSYKKNFTLIITIFVSAILLAGLLINFSGLDSLWMNRGPAKGLYRRYDGTGKMQEIKEPGWRMKQYEEKSLDTGTLEKVQ